MPLAAELPSQPSHPSDTDEFSRLRAELESLKVATMHSMVDEVTCDVNDSPVDIKSLFLTNEQASTMSRNNMPKVRDQLGIKQHKMVVRLMSSHYSSVYWKSFLYWTSGEDGGRFPTKSVPEVSDEWQERTEHQLILLAKDVLLPLATRTGSLVIGSESCALTAAFVQVSAPLERQLGEDCPFRLLIFAKAYIFHMKSMEEETVASHVRRANKQWNQNRNDMAKGLEKVFGEDEAFWPFEDLPTGKYSLILFECMSMAGLTVETANNFQNDFISFLSEELPVIALQTYGTNKMNMVPALADHVARGLPLMLVDSRKRWPETEVYDAHKQLKQFSQDLHTSQRGPRIDQYFTSVLAFVKGTLDAKRRKLRTRAGVASSHALKASRAFHDSQESAPDEPVGKAQMAMSLLEEERMDSHMWIWEAIEHRQVHCVRNSENDKASVSAQAAEEEDLVEATNIIMGYVGGELEWESNQLTQRCEEGIGAVLDAKTWEEFETNLQKNWIKIRASCFHFFGDARTFAQDHPWIRLDEKERRSCRGTKILRIILDDPAFAYTPENLNMAKEELGTLLLGALQVSKDYDALHKTKLAFVSNEDMWLAVYDILKAPTVYTGNLHFLEHVNGTLFSLAQIDRLPSRSTLEALVLIRTAWTVIDYYNANATIYKAYAKATQMMMLLLGVVTVTFTVLCSIFQDKVTADEERITLLALALLGSALTGYTAIVDPARKWMHLRSGAYKLEAEIWKFRVRVGDYQGSSTSTTYHGRMLDERKAEAALQGTILQVQGRVRLSTGLKDSSFYSMPTTTNDLGSSETQSKTGKATVGSAKSVASASTPSTPVSRMSMHSASSRGGRGARHGAGERSTLKLSRIHYQHSQYRKEKAPVQKLAPGKDSHHAPAKPEDYIRWRLVPKMEFYQARIPKYALRRRTFQAIILLSSLASSLLAALNLGHWTAIIAGVSSAVAGWQEFVDVAKKLQRYSTISAALGNVLVWWQALTEVDQANVRNIALLVDRTEGLLNDERSAWVSDASVNVRLTSSNGNAQGQKSGGNTGSAEPSAAKS